MENPINETVLKQVLHQLNAKINPSVDALHASSDSAQYAVLKVFGTSLHKKRLYNALERYDAAKKDGSNEHHQAATALNEELLHLAVYLAEICIVVNKDLLNATKG